MAGLSKLAWEAQRSGLKGEEGMRRLQHEAASEYPAQLEAAKKHARRVERRTGKIAYVVFAPTMHRAYAKHPHQKEWYATHHWPFSVSTSMHRTRATAPVIWSTHHGFRVHELAEERRRRSVSRGLARDPSARYRVVWVRDDKGTRGVVAPGPFTLSEAQTVKRKTDIHPRSPTRIVVERIHTRRSR